MSGAAALLSALAAHGVTVALSPAGDGLTLSGRGRPPAALLDEVRVSKAALIEALSLAKAKPAPLLSTVERVRPAPLPSPDPLPAHLAALVDAAKAGKLRPGTVTLASGLVPDLGVYVLAWAECWPRDRVHILRRLEEAYTALEKTP